MGEYERTCVICDSSRDPDEHEFLDTSKEHSIFATVSAHLLVAESHKLWDFEKDPLPFCTHCKTTSVEIEHLTKVIRELKAKVSEKIGSFHKAIRLSVEGDNQKATADNKNSPLPDWGAIQLDFSDAMELTMVAGMHSSKGEVSHRYKRFREEVILKNGADEAGGIVETEEVETVEDEVEIQVKHVKPMKTVEGHVNENHDEIQSSCSRRMFGDIDDIYAVSISSIGTASMDQYQINTSVIARSPLRVSDWCDEVNYKLPLSELLESSTRSNYMDSETHLMKVLCNDNSPKERWEKKEDGHYFMNIRTVEENNGLVCLAEGCSFTISLAKENYKKRMAYHIQERHYGRRKCPAVGCPKRFLEMNKEALNKHLEEDHSPVTSEETTQPIAVQNCPNCSKSYKDKRSFAHHVSTCGPNQPGSALSPDRIKFICPECSKPFKKKSNYLRHWETHQKSLDERKSSLCPRCAKCMTKEGLTEHLRSVHKIGSPINPVKCHSCPKTFPNKSRMKKHSKVHLQESPKQS